jgi:hypothetical protein
MPVILAAWKFEIWGLWLKACLGKVCRRPFINQLDDMPVIPVMQRGKIKRIMISVFSLICRLYIKGKYSKVIGLWTHDKVRAHKGGMRIGETPTKHDSIWCAQCKGTNAETLKRQRPIGEGDQELQKRSVREEST